ncbi:hypothetical protein ACOMHN_059930 [Nucella lapillus]
MVTFIVLLRSQEGQGCQCPSCHYTSATQNCQCCVFRQLGKRGDRAMTPDLALSTNPILTRYLSQPISYDLTSRLQNGESLPLKDWSPKRHQNLFYYGRGFPGNDDSVTSQQGREPVLRDGLPARYARVNSVLEQRLGLLENLNLDSSLENADSDEMFSYN